jgi:DNA-binding MurR/RpiR family transcriptional regulator
MLYSQVKGDLAMQNAELSESEKYLWNYIERNRREIAHYSIVKLSELANVSTATIVRTMKKKGFDGFTAFKYYLKDKQLSGENFSALEKAEKGIRSAILKNEQEVIRTIQMIEIADIEDAVQKIYVAKRILIFARGFSELIAQEMMVKFQLSGKYCEMHTDPEIIKSISKKLTTKDLVIFVSLNGETKELLIAAKNCFEKEIGTLLLTANRHSSIMSYIEIPLVGFKSLDSYFPDYEVRSRLPLSILARILLDSFALRMRDGYFG